MRSTVAAKWIPNMGLWFLLPKPPRDSTLESSMRAQPRRALIRDIVVAKSESIADALYKMAIDMMMMMMIDKRGGTLSMMMMIDKRAL